MGEVIFWLGFAAFVVFGFSGAIKKESPRQVDKTRPPQIKSAPQSPFDSKTAKPIQTQLVLEGPAYVIDGDTIIVQKTQIRLYGVDAPEMDHPHGKQAKWAMVGLCKGQVVRAEITQKDAYDRTVAKCYLPDGRDLSAEMVKLGLALDWPKFSGGKYLSLEVADARKKLWLADARQKGRMHVWEQFEYNQLQKKRNSRR